MDKKDILVIEKVLKENGFFENQIEKVIAQIIKELQW